MNNEEYVRAQQVIAESTSTFIVTALTESIEQLQSEITFLKEENTRLRRAVKVTRTERRKITENARDLVKQVEEMGAHIFDIAAQEAEIDEHGFVDAEPDGNETYPLDAEEKNERDKQKAHEEFTRGWVERTYQEMRASGEYPEQFPLSPAEVYSTATKTGESIGRLLKPSDEPQTT